MSLNDINSLSHSKWNCKYHVVFAPKYRRMVFYGEKKVIVGKILRQLCEWKGVKIIQAELCPDHVHMLLEIPPKIAVSSFMGYLKGKSTTMIYEQFPELKYKYRNREFWCKGYYVDTVGKNEGRIAEYIKHPECLYLLAMLDYISRLNDIPMCTQYNELRNMKLKETIFPSSMLMAARVTKNNNLMQEAVKAAIPEFMRFNIVESEVRNVI